MEVPKQEVAKPVTKPPPSSSATLSLTLLSSLQELRRRLELAESGLTSHLHVPLGENGVHQCSVHIQRLQVGHAFIKYRSYCHLFVLISWFILYLIASRVCTKSWTPFMTSTCKSERRLRRSWTDCRLILNKPSSSRLNWKSSTKNWGCCRVSIRSTFKGNSFFIQPTAEGNERF